MSTQYLNSEQKQLSLSEYQSIEQTKALYYGWRTSLFALVLTAILTVAVLWPAMDHGYLIAWLCLNLAIAAGREFSFKGFLSSEVTISNYSSRLSLMSFWGVITGLPWIAAAMLFISNEQPAYSLVVSTIYTGTLASVALSWSAHLKSYFSYALPTVSALFISYAIQGTVFSYSVAILLVGFLLIMTLYCQVSSKALKEKSRLSYENASLVSQLTTQNMKAEQAVLAKNQFLAAASHDLRQPLHASGLFIDALDHLDLGDEASAIIDKLGQSNIAINNLLHGLLDISRLDANVVEYLPKHFDLSSVLTRVYNEYELASRDLECDIELQIPEFLYAYSDNVIFERVVRNLVDNAVKFTKQGLVSIRAEEKDQNTILLSINDTGKGIPESQHEYIFSEFSQLNNPERDRQKGLGLGLAIVQRLCKLINVGLFMTSEEGAGTQFTLQVPIGNQIEASKSYQPQAPLLTGRCVLVIDDEADILDGMRRILEASEAKVVTAVDAISALQQLDEYDLHPDVIVADLRLRDNHNGIDAVESLREEFNDDIKAILVTGDTSSDRLLLARSADMLLIHKPVSADKLRSAIKTVLASKC